MRYFYRLLYQNRWIHPFVSVSAHVISFEIQYLVASGVIGLLPWLAQRPRERAFKIHDRLNISATEMWYGVNLQFMIHDISKCPTSPCLTADKVEFRVTSKGIKMRLLNC